MEPRPADGEERALLLHSEPDEVMDVLQSCRGLRWGSARRPDEVAPALAAHRPTVVLSIKHSGFPGPAHRAALVAPGVRWFHVGGAGRDHLEPVPPGVRVTDSAGVLAPFHAERALAALLHLTARIGVHARAQADRRWEPARFRSLHGRTLLVVGAGHTGTALAAQEVIAAYAIAQQKHPGLIFAGMFNQRTKPAWKEIKRLCSDGSLEIGRAHARTPATPPPLVCPLLL